MFLKNSGENIKGQKSGHCRDSNEADNAYFDIFSISGKCTNAFLFYLSFSTKTCHAIG